MAASCQNVNSCCLFLLAFKTLAAPLKHGFQPCRLPRQLRSKDGIARHKPTTDTHHDAMVDCRGAMKWFSHASIRPCAQRPRCHHTQNSITCALRPVKSSTSVIVSHAGTMDHEVFNMASTKMVVGLRVDVDFSEVYERHEQLPWVDMAKLDQSVFGEMLQDTVYQIAKIEIICPDDYLDLTVFSPELSEESQLSAINDFARIFLAQSMKRRKGSLVQVSKHLPNFTGHSQDPLRAPPGWIFFIIKGSTKMTTEYWLSQFMLLMRVRRAVYDQQPGRSPIGCWEPTFKKVVEDCFGIKLKDNVLVGRIL